MGFIPSSHWIYPLVSRDFEKISKNYIVGEIFKIPYSAEIFTTGSFLPGCFPSCYGKSSATLNLMANGDLIQRDNHKT
jgi:hypothetical protein